MGAYPIVTSPSRTLGVVVGDSRVIKLVPAAPSRNLRLPILAPRGKTWLSEALLEANPTRQQRRTGNLVASIVLHTALFAAVLLPSLYFTQTIDFKQFAQTLLVAPPPPPPQAAPAMTRPRPVAQRTFLTGAKLLAPIAIPNRVVILKEEPPDVSIGVAGGVPGGVPGGQLGGVIGGIISGTSRAYVPAPPASRSNAPFRVGGRIKVPRPLVHPAPSYPILAKQIRLQGAVSIDAVIDTEGNVVEMGAVSGDPLLIPAALEALRQWKYEPSYLDDQAIAVQLIVTVTFKLD